jgi:hypothetical protein
MAIIECTVIQRKAHLGEIIIPNNGSYQWRYEVSHQRAHHCRKSSADDHRHRQVYHIAAQ